MKLICLNVWGGNLKEDLCAFVAKHADDTDIFCFQEVTNKTTSNREVLGKIDRDIYDAIVKLLPGHEGFFATEQTGEEGNAIFIKSSIGVYKVCDVFVYRYLDAMIDDDSSTLGRNIQAVFFSIDNQRYTIINFHGLWDCRGKIDTVDRLDQSQKIKDFIDNKAEGKIILVGDFNLNPDAKSLSIFEDKMRNLIKDYDVSSTRSCLYKKPEKFADYVIVSKDVDVVRFEVLQDVVSDHLPLLLEFK